jgi:prepilin-type N-terminal cleavage/methylation domain-containing protein
MSRNSRRRSGFTLLEATIAVMIVGMAAAAVLSSFGTTLRTAARARQGLEAEALAGQRLARAALLDRDDLVHLPDSIARGRFAPPYGAYEWRATSGEVRGEPDLFDVGVEVSWPEGRYSLPTRLYRPARQIAGTP